MLYLMPNSKQHLTIGLFELSQRDVKGFRDVVEQVRRADAALLNAASETTTAASSCGSNNTAATLNRSSRRTSRSEVWVSQPACVTVASLSCSTAARHRDVALSAAVAWIVADAATLPVRASARADVFAEHKSATIASSSARAAQISLACTWIQRATSWSITDNRSTDLTKASPAPVNVFPARPPYDEAMAKASVISPQIWESRTSASRY